MYQRRQWQSTPVLLPGKSHGWRSLVGSSPWGHEEPDTTEQLHFHFSLSCFGEGNGNPLQCSCLENPRDCGAWWPAIYGVTQSQTRLKRLSSSSHTCIASLIIHIRCQSGPFVTTDEPILTHHNCIKPVVYLRVDTEHNSWCCICYGFEQMCNNTYPSLWCHVEYFHCPEKSSLLHLFILHHPYQPLIF